MDNIKKDSYRTVARATEMTLFKERKSKFYGYAFPIQKEEDVKPVLALLQESHPKANHFCYAWQLGVHKTIYRANDDGEPNNSAGAPIHGQILSFDVTNLIVVVVRVFGGTKLGVGGLIGAYRECARLTLENATIVSKTLKRHLQIQFEYDQMSPVMRFIKQHKLTLVEQVMDRECLLVVAVRQKRAQAIMEQLKDMHRIRSTWLD